MAKRKKLDYEASVSELESLVNRLEQGDISLEESLKLYERGVLLAQWRSQDALQGTLRTTKYELLLQQSGQSTLVDFDPNTSES
ncbi:MAG: exodeoxyribonuclease VII small subunit [Gammaproteobacteria bacterium]|nr:exodeoxyribonuclease VII small subunit [Gammaproteobacteria bacterium]